jgi:hypothetical protein
MKIGSKRGLWPVAALLGLGSALAAPPPQVEMDVAFLLGSVGNSGCSFYRNGSWSDAPAAEAHLRNKYRSLAAADGIGTTEQFIERAATRSSFSGQDYAVRCGDGPTVSSRQWLLDRLARHRAQP